MVLFLSLLHAAIQGFLLSRYSLRSTPCPALGWCGDTEGAGEGKPAPWSSQWSQESTKGGVTVCRAGGRDPGLQERVEPGLPRS